MALVRARVALGLTDPAARLNAELVTLVPARVVLGQGKDLLPALESLIGRAQRPDRVEQAAPLLLRQA